MPRDGSSILGHVWPFMWHALHGSSFNTTGQNICPYDPHVDECAPAYMYPHCTGNFSTKSSFWGSLNQTILKMSCGFIFLKRYSAPQPWNKNLHLSLPPFPFSPLHDRLHGQWASMLGATTGFSNIITDNHGKSRKIMKNHGKSWKFTKNNEK